MDAFDIEGYEYSFNRNYPSDPPDYGRRYVLSHCHWGNLASEIDVNGTRSWHKDVSVSRVRRTAKTKATIASLTEWYINGTNTMIFSRFTDRVQSYGFKRIRDPGLGGNISIGLKPLRHSSRDCALIETKDFSFVLYKIPASYAPSWSVGFGIEYRTTWVGYLGRTNAKPWERSPASSSVGG